MQYGTVNGYLEAGVALTLLGSNDEAETVDFTIDTGFTDELTLPQDSIDRLNLLRDDEGVAFTLADGTVRVMDRYIGRVEWHGQVRVVNVISMGSETLLGMAMLAGSNLSVDATPGGVVTITELA